MKDFLVTVLGVSWRTSVLAIVLAVLLLFFEHEALPGGINWGTFGRAAIIIVFGRLAKEAQVTGGSVPQTKEAEARAKSPTLTEKNKKRGG